MERSGDIDWCRSGSRAIPFLDALLREGIDTTLTGDVGKVIPRDYIKATVGFEKLGEAMGT
jgi:hypothetical protein